MQEMSNKVIFSDIFLHFGSGWTGIWNFGKDGKILSGSWFEQNDRISDNNRVTDNHFINDADIVLLHLRRHFDG
jgi:hypothetical protein